MAKSVHSQYQPSVESSIYEFDEDDDDEVEEPSTTSFNPIRRNPSASEAELRAMSQSQGANEQTGLLRVNVNNTRRYDSVPSTPRPQSSRHHSYGGTRTAGASRHHSRSGSFSQRLSKALIKSPRVRQFTEGPFDVPIPALVLDDRVWYDQFTSTDWVHGMCLSAFVQAVAN
jgi:chloride channel 3/4/5